MSARGAQAAVAVGRGQPTFLFIGPDKTGSTWLYEVLRQHPRCYVPKIKDIYFFDRHYDRGLDWYLEFFKDAGPTDLAVGELSHDYLFSTAAPARIQHDFPEIKLLTCLRDPVARTFSHYLYLVRSGLTRAPFEQALSEFPELINNSQYARHLEPFVDLFGAQLKVLFFEHLDRDAASFAKDVFDFIGLPAAPAIDYAQQVLPASRPRSHALARSAKFGATLARKLGMVNLVGVVKRSFVRELLYASYKSIDKPTMDDAVGVQLRSTFAPDVERLAGVLDVDLKHWLPD